MFSVAFLQKRRDDARYPVRNRIAELNYELIVRETLRCTAPAFLSSLNGGGFWMSKYDFEYDLYRARWALTIPAESHYPLSSCKRTTNTVVIRSIFEL